MSVGSPHEPASHSHEVDVDDFLSGQATADSERRAQLSLVQELLHRAETAMRTGDGENEALAAEIENRSYLQRWDIECREEAASRALARLHDDRSGEEAPDAD